MAPRSYQLLQQAGPSPGKVISLEKSEIFMGRDINNDIVISDSEVSRKHARLVLVSTGEYQLEDLGSTNGTYIDGQRITGPHLMYPGETIMLGDNVRLHFDTVARDPEATMAAAAAGFQPAPAAGPPPQQLLAAPASPAAAPALPTTQETQTPEPAKKGRNGMVWVVAGLGCVVILLCVLILGVLAFDYFQLYCIPPFNILFPC
ncbi:MAG TPA: FHA domain-containing protein [Anaerolineales bacterium]|nr:FHA domain-containing protein [Anaerolineales bacterium]